ncbi:unnamed protein product, partial [Effrenium voratum]
MPQAKSRRLWLSSFPKVMLEDLLHLWAPDGCASEGPPPPLPAEILACRCGVLAVCKPAGVRTEELLEDLYTAWNRPMFLVSRLDHPTSGVLPIALGEEGSATVSWLQAQFAGRLVEK